MCTSACNCRFVSCFHSWQKPAIAIQTEVLVENCSNPEKTESDLLGEGTTDAFWERVPMAEMSQEQWESLCDGCGRCCLNKVEDWDTGEIIWTDLACRLLDHESCQCKDYANRFEKVPECLQLTPQSVQEITWLPPSCAYARLRDGKPLLWWHPLLSGDPDTVKAAGIAVRGRIKSETGVPIEEYEEHLVSWPVVETGE